METPLEKTDSGNVFGDVMPFTVLSSPAPTLFLAAFVPVLAMVAKHTRRFFGYQIENSLWAAGAAGGALSGWCLLFSPPPVFPAILSGLVFFLFGERIIRFAFTRPMPLWQYCLFSIGATSMLAFYQPFLGVNVILLIFGGCCARRTYRDWRTRKTENMLERTFPTDNHDDAGIRLQHKPNIYFFYLESVQSKEGLFRIYDVDNDFCLAESLQSKGFTVYDNTLSNGTWTTFSLEMLLSMANRVNNAGMTIDSGYRLALSVLRNNGYEINMFDRGVYVFNKISNYADNTNFTQADRVFTLFHLFSPVIATNSLFVAFGGGVDPSDIKYSDEEVCCALVERHNKKSEKPQFYLTRIGSYGFSHDKHKHEIDPVAARREHYLAAYKRTARLCLETSDVILADDPGASIFFMGDHGSFGYSEGVDQLFSILSGATSVGDHIDQLFDVFCAIRWPAGCTPPKGPMSQVNVLRNLFRLLGGESPALVDEPNIMHLDEKRIVCRDEKGFRVAQWPPQTGTDPLSRAHAQLASGNYANASELLLPLADDPVRNISAVYLLLRTLARLGQADRAKKIVVKAMDSCHRGSNEYDILLYEYTRILIILGKYTAAGKTMKLVKRTADRHRLKITLHTMRGDLAKALREFDRWEVDDAFHIPQPMLDLTKGHLWSLGAMKRLRANILLQKSKSALWAPAFHHELLFEQGVGNWEKVEQAGLEDVADVTLSMTPSAYMFIAGAQEQMGKFSEAGNTFSAGLEKYPDCAQLSAEFGLFILRQGWDGPELLQHANAAQSYLNRTLASSSCRELFLSDWYQRQYGDMLREMEPFEHFVHFGNMLMLNPNPYFDSVYYALAQPAIAESCIAPLVHYAGTRPEDVVDPSLRFPAVAYINQYPEIVEQGINPLAHFLKRQRGNERAL